MKLPLLMALAEAFCLSVFAEQPNLVRTSYSDEVIPQVVAGGGWNTTFTFVNLEDKEVTFPLVFRTSDGQPWNVSLTDGRQSSMDVVLPPKASKTITTADAPELTQGWAQIDVPCCNNIGGYAVFRQRVAGRPDFEAVVPFAGSFTSRAAIMFDNTEGNSTGIAIVSTSSFTAATVTVAIRDEGGSRIALDQFTIPVRSKQVFSMPDRWREAAGRRGTIEFTSSPGQFAVMGLRFNPTGAFTSIHALEP